VLGEPRLGRLGIGLPADLVVLDDRLELRRVLVAGDVRVAA
jgi:N-acetylglucosamine-6-phosphate deacetylase